MHLFYFRGAAHSVYDTHYKSLIELKYIFRLGVIRLKNLD